MAKSIIEIKNISYSFWGETVLDDISMSFPAGKLITITGPSGSGKSHFLKIVAGLIEPDSGAVFIDGVDISELSRGQLFQMRQKFGFVFEDSALLNNLSVYDNIALPLSYHSNISPEEIEEKVDQKLEDFGLKALRDALPVRLSTGQKKLVGMARTLVIEPELIFFDEPVTGVDALSREKVFNAVLQLQGDPNITLVSVSHNLDFIKRYADYIALIYDKRLFAYGQKDEILKSNDPILQQILSVIVDEESVIADQVLGLLTGEE